MWMWITHTSTCSLQRVSWQKMVVIVIARQKHLQFAVDSTSAHCLQAETISSSKWSFQFQENGNTICQIYIRHPWGSRVSIILTIEGTQYHEHGTNLYGNFSVFRSPLIKVQIGGNKSESLHSTKLSFRVSWYRDCVLSILQDKKTKSVYANQPLMFPRFQAPKHYALKLIVWPNFESYSKLQSNARTKCQHIGGTCGRIVTTYKVCWWRYCFQINELC